MSIPPPGQNLFNPSGPFITEKQICGKYRIEWATRIDPVTVTGSNAAVNQKRLAIVAFGDSITQQGFDYGGWLSQLSSYFSRKADVFNRGFTQYSTPQAVRLLRQFLKFKNWPVTPSGPGVQAPNSLVTLSFGANDSAWPKTNTQHCGLSIFTANLNTMVAELKKNFEPKICLVLITPPPIDGATFQRVFIHTGKFTLENYPQPRYNHITKLYAKALIKVARQHKIPYVDMWSAIQQKVNPSMKSLDKELDDEKGEEPEEEKKLVKELADGIHKPSESDEVKAMNLVWSQLYLRDGLHLNAEGNKLQFELVKQAIERGHQEFNLPELVLDAPLFDNISSQNLPLY